MCIRDSLYSVSSMFDVANLVADAMRDLERDVYKRQVGRAYADGGPGTERRAERVGAVVVVPALASGAWRFVNSVAQAAGIAGDHAGRVADRPPSAMAERYSDSTLATTCAQS